jgi:hypothetical protein
VRRWGPGDEECPPSGYLVVSRFHTAVSLIRHCVLHGACTTTRSCNHSNFQWWCARSAGCEFNCVTRGMFGKVGDRGQDLLLVGAAGFVGSAIVTFIQPSKWSFGIRWVHVMCWAASSRAAPWALGTGPCVWFSHMMLPTCRSLGASLARSARTARPSPEEISALVSCAIMLQGEGDLYPLLCNSLAE